MNEKCTNFVGEAVSFPYSSAKICFSVRCPQGRTPDCHARDGCAEDSARYSALVLTNHELDLGAWIELFCEAFGVRPRPRVALGQ
jgi:hypothetical protein